MVVNPVVIETEEDYAEAQEGARLLRDKIRLAGQELKDMKWQESIYTDELQRWEIAKGV